MSTSSYSAAKRPKATARPAICRNGKRGPTHKESQAVRDLVHGPTFGVSAVADRFCRGELPKGRLARLSRQKIERVAVTNLVDFRHDRPPFGLVDKFGRSLLQRANELLI